ncbi:hypothetical protein EMCRGX_G004577 [Ephydatia muelleri]
MDIQLQGQMVSIDFVVVEMLKVESLMGLDFLERYSCVVDLSEKVLQFKGVQVPLSKQTANRKHCQIGRVNVSLLETVTIPPFSEVETLANTELGEGDGGIWLLEGLEHPNLSVLVAAAVVSPLQEDALCSVPIRMVNPLSTEVVVHKGTKIAKLEKMDEWMLAPIQLTETAAEEIPEVPMHKQDVLHEMAEQCGVGLTVEEKSQLFHLLLAYADVFADAEDGLGRTRVVKHSIVTGDNPPIKQSCRRAPPSKREHVRQLIQDMLKKDVIQPSSSPWASPVVIVQKKDGSYRFCVDYRKINTITRKDAYPLPRIDDTIEALSGSQWFSTLDLLWGYWQVEMSEEDRAKTAFSTHEVLDRIKRAGLRLKPSKCHLFQKEILYLGHRITRDGVATDPGKIDAVRKWAVPRTVQEVQRFLGLVGYYRKFVSNFAATAKPLYRLTERGREFIWTTECEAAFLKLKSRLVSAPILAFPDFTKMFILDTDASQSGVGAVLSQLHDGQERVVAYASRVLSKAERQYSVTRKELLAVIHSDQGRQFESNLVQDICKLLHVNKTRTTPYHPQSDGLVERFNRTLISMLATTVHELSVEWDKCFKKVCMAYNTSVHPSTGFTPFFLMFGRQAKLPLDIIYGSTPTEPQPVHEYAKNLKRSLEDAYSRVREHLGTTVERQKEVYDLKVHGKAFEIGDLVWLHNPVVGRGMAKKLHCPWSGPFRIIKKLSSVVYRIQDTRRARKNRKVVHFDRLKPCSENTRLDDSNLEVRSQTEPGVSDVLPKNRKC